MKRLVSVELPPRVQMWLAIATAVLSISAAGVAGAAFDKVSQVANDAQENSLLTCQRTVRTAPHLSRFYQRERVFPTDVQKFYDDTLPRGCAK